MYMKWREMSRKRAPRLSPSHTFVLLWLLLFCFSTAFRTAKHTHVVFCCFILVWWIRFFMRIIMKNYSFASTSPNRLVAAIIFIVAEQTERMNTFRCCFVYLIIFYWILLLFWECVYGYTKHDDSWQTDGGDSVVGDSSAKLMNELLGAQWVGPHCDGHLNGSHFEIWLRIGVPSSIIHLSIQQIQLKNEEDVYHYSYWVETEIRFFCLSLKMWTFMSGLVWFGSARPRWMPSTNTNHKIKYLTRCRRASSFWLELYIHKYVLICAALHTIMWSIFRHGFVLPRTARVCI